MHQKSWNVLLKNLPKVFSKYSGVSQGESWPSGISYYWIPPTPPCCVDLQAFCVLCITLYLRWRQTTSWGGEILKQACNLQWDSKLFQLLQLSSGWPFPLLSAKRPTGRNQPKLPLLIQRDRWIQSRSAFALSFIQHFHHSLPSLPPGGGDETEREKNPTDCLCERSCFKYSHRLLYLPLQSFTVCMQLAVIKTHSVAARLSRRGSRTSRDGLACVFLPPIHRCPSPRHTNQCSSGKDTPLGPTQS